MSNDTLDKIQLDLDFGFLKDEVKKFPRILNNFGAVQFIFGEEKINFPCYVSIEEKEGFIITFLQ